MTTTDYSALDRPEISRNSFYPRPNWSPTPEGAVDLMLPVADDVSLSCRFFPAAADRPTILFFYGNGETAADYDGIAPLYSQLGVNFFVSDYRGYGNSGGIPSFSTMLADAHRILDGLRSILLESLYYAPIFVMGRSMGRHAAFELATQAAEGLAGVVIESGRPTLGQFTYGLTPEQAQQFESDYRDKVSSINLPALVLHGEMDTLAPVGEATSMYESFVSTNKRLVTIPGAGHNDLLYLGLSPYFDALRDFLMPARR